MTPSPSEHGTGTVERGSGPTRSASRQAELTGLTLVSLSRFAFALLFVSTTDLALRLGLVLAAGLSDVVDGYWARRRNLVTRWGALVDPLADRTFVLTVLVTYLVEGALSGWAFAVLITRDVATTVAFGLTRLLPTFRRVQFQARVSGKVVTFTQFLVLVLMPFLPEYVPVVVVLNGLATAWAIADYSMAVWRNRERPPRTPRPSMGIHRPGHVT